MGSKKCQKSDEISTYKGNLNESEKTSKKVEKSEKNAFFRVKTGFSWSRKAIPINCSLFWGRKPVSGAKKTWGGTCFGKNAFSQTRNWLTIFLLLGFSKIATSGFSGFGGSKNVFFGFWRLWGWKKSKFRGFLRLEKGTKKRSKKWRKSDQNLDKIWDFFWSEKVGRKSDKKVVKKSSNFEQIFAFFWCFFYHKNLCKFFMRKKQKLNDSLDEKTNFLIK